MHTMQNDQNNKVRKIFEEATPKAARIFVVNFVGKTVLKISDDELPDLVLEALNKLPKTGNIRR